MILAVSLRLKPLELSGTFSGTRAFVQDAELSLIEKAYRAFPCGYLISSGAKRKGGVLATHLNREAIRAGQHEETQG
jgi:hypothetical protein